MDIDLLKQAIERVYNLPYVITESRTAPLNHRECLQGLFSVFSPNGMQRTNVYLFGRDTKIGGSMIVYPHAVYIAENILYNFSNPEKTFTLIRYEEGKLSEQTFKGMCYAYPVIRDYSKKAILTC